jgi:hypothetical protein
MLFYIHFVTHIPICNQIDLNGYIHNFNSSNVIAYFKTHKKIFEIYTLKHITIEI